MRDVTRILTAIDGGDARAVDELLPIIYQELRRLAAQKLAGESPGQTLQATALVHEAYIRLVGAEAPGFSGLTVEQAAEVLGISRATADRYWSYARAWLYHEINRSDDSS